MEVNQPSDVTEDVSPQAEPAPTPLFSSAAYPLEEHRTVDVTPERRSALDVSCREIAETWDGSPERHSEGKYGEDAFFQYVGSEEQLNVDVIPDGGDGGIDGFVNGASVQIKTVGRQHAHQPELWVDTNSPSKADYYVLVSRLGPSTFRLVGYVPRWFVWNAPTRTHNGGTYRVVDREYLFPIPKSRPVEL